MMSCKQLSKSSAVAFACGAGNFPTATGPGPAGLLQPTETYLRLGGKLIHATFPHTFGQGGGTSRVTRSWLFGVTVLIRGNIRRS